MRRSLVPAILLAALTISTLSACGKDSGSLTDPTSPGLPGGGGSGTGGGGSGGGGFGGSGDTLSGPKVDSAKSNGGWTDPDGVTPTIEPVDSTQFTPSGTGSAGTDGASTSLVFQTSGVARYGVGSCGAEGTWTDAQGQTYGPHNPNCLAYYSDGRVGNNNKGQCVTSPEGWPGLWLNPEGHPTSPYHSQCLQLGSTSTTLALSFPAQAVLYVASDGSGAQVLDFVSQGATVAQLIYHGTADGTTTGAGTLVGTDNGSPAKIWTVDFAQPALNYTGGATNGDLVGALQDTGVQAVGCNTAIGCSLVTLKVTITP